MANIKTKRIYDPFSKTDGYRILVDRLWPRGMTKQAANVDTWLKDIAPSTELRQWFHAEPGRWEQFRLKYIDELKQSNSVDELATYIKEHQTVTLLYSVKDEEHNHALILLEFIKPYLH
ncbi:MAG TPA: DUF488 family protein [Mucilaginibacter sp.]|jgi:uncharacterized protein YeaO (DUF488 family)|nr:DUF488 family protein [Mucilaginibacter sp.]